MTTPFPFVSAAVLTAAQMNAITTLVTSTKTASHTLTIADVSTRVIMNSASATTITVNTSIFGASDIVEILNIGSGVCTVTAGTCTVGTSGSLALAQNAGGKLTFISASASVFQADGVTASPSGLVCVKAETAFTAVASFTADSLFTSTYTNYRIVVSTTSSTASSLSFVLRVGGVSTTSNYADERLYVDGTTNAGGRVTAQSSQRMGDISGAFFSIHTIEMFNPFVAQATNFMHSTQTNYGAYTTPTLVLHYGNQSASTAFDGINIAVGSGTITGTYAVYGYSKVV